MITKFEKYNEGIKHLLVGTTKEEVWSDYINGDLKGLINHIPESPEDFIIQMKDGCEEMFRNTHSIFYGKNNIILFQHILKDKELYISHKFIWSVLEKIYELKYFDIQTLIKNSLLNDTKWKGLTPYHGSQWFK